MEISLRGQLKLEPHPHWSPYGVNLNFQQASPSLLHGSPPHQASVSKFEIVVVTLELVV